MENSGGVFAVGTAAQRNLNDEDIAPDIFHLKVRYYFIGTFLRHKISIWKIVKYYGYR